MLRFAGSCRFVFNRALALQKELFELSGGPCQLRGSVCCAGGLEAGQRDGWLNEAPSQALQQSLKNLDAAWARRLDSLKKLKQGRIKRAQLMGEPVFKKKEKHASFRYPQGTCLEHNNRIWLPKLGWVRYRNSREVLGAVKNVTVSLAGGRWLVSIQTEREVEVPVHRSATAVDIDMGVVRLATLSDGTIYGTRNSCRQHQAGLRKSAAIHEPEKPEPKKEVQPELEKSEGSARLPSHPCSQCTSGLSTQGLDRDQQKPRDRVCRGSSGKQPVELGCWQHAESGEQGAGQVWPESIDPRPGLGELRRQLEYKLAWNGGRLIAVPAIDTSRTCPECGCTGEGNRKTQARFCVECGYEANADLVAAINVRRAGLARIACEVNDGVSRQQQEPTPVSA